MGLIGFLAVVLVHMTRRGGSEEVRAVLDTWYRLLAANCADARDVEGDLHIT
jgi:hypothetical protein